MKELENFKAGHYESGYGYKYFVPNHINDEWTWKDPKIAHLLERAAIKLGELNSFSRFVPNINLFIQLYVAKEAVVSSRIEGTQTEMEEALLPEMEILPERRNDWKEVNNYIDAINEAIVKLNHLPISSRLIRSTHKTLLANVRGEYKLPGEYRNSQNWIGGNSLTDAKFIPPHHQYIDELMSDLEKFLNNDELQIPSLLKIAIAHYQFETIHPFLDGNGRIGRLLITLFLVKEKILDKPILYLSTYFDKNRNTYYDNLNNIRTKDDIIQWIKYFLIGVEQTADKAIDTLVKIISLKEETENSINKNFGRRSANGIILLQSLFKNPFVTIDIVSKICDVTFKAANDLVRTMCENNILEELTGHNRNRMFVFKAYLKLFDSK